MITLEMVEELRKEMDVDYRIAEKALRKGKESVDGAMIWLKKRDERWNRRFMTWCVKSFKHCYSYMLIINKGEDVFFNVPLIIVIGLLIILDIRSYQWPFIAIVLFLLVVISKSSVKIKMKEKEQETTEKEAAKTNLQTKGTVIHSENDIPVVMNHAFEIEPNKEKTILPEVAVIEDEDGFNEIIISK
jgi:hypothetical protein